MAHGQRIYFAQLNAEFLGWVVLLLFRIPFVRHKLPLEKESDCHTHGCTSCKLQLTTSAFTCPRSVLYVFPSFLDLCLVLEAMAIQLVTNEPLVVAIAVAAQRRGRAIGSL